MANVLLEHRINDYDQINIWKMLRVAVLLCDYAVALGLMICLWHADARVKSQYSSAILVCFQAVTIPVYHVSNISS